MTKAEIRKNIINHIIECVKDDTYFSPITRYGECAGLYHSEVFYVWGSSKYQIPVVKFLRNSVEVKGMRCKDDGTCVVSSTVCKLAYDFITDEMLDVMCKRIVNMTDAIVQKRKVIALRKFRKAQKND